MKTFSANKFYFIVSDKVDKATLDLYNIVRMRCEQHNLLSEYLSVGSRDEFNKAISHIEGEAKNGILPYIHIEAHGYERDEEEDGGLQLISGEKVDWKNLTTFFTEINIACRNNLFVSLASCWGGNFIGFIFDKLNKGEKARSPVFGFIGSTREIFYDEYVIGYEDYFNTLICDKDVSKAYKQLLNSANDEEAFIIETTEQLFKDLIDLYIKNIVRPRFESKENYMNFIIEQAVNYSKANGKLLKLQEVEYLHNLFISEQNFVETINKLRGDFFMIDIDKENDKKVDKVGGINNWDMMIAHLK